MWKPVWAQIGSQGSPAHTISRTASLKAILIQWLSKVVIECANFFAIIRIFNDIDDDYWYWDIVDDDKDDNIRGDNDGGPGGALTIIMLQLTRIHTPQLVNKTQRVVSETYQIINEPHKSCLTQWRGKAQQIWYHDHEMLFQDYETRHPIGAFPKPDLEKKSKSLRLHMATWRATSRCAVEPRKQTRDCTHAN